MKRVIIGSSYIKSERALTVDVNGLKNSTKSICEQAINELDLPIDGFTISDGSLEKIQRPVHYIFTFNLHLRGDIKPAYRSQQDEEGNVKLSITLYKIPTNVDITPELLYEDNFERVKEYIRSHVYTDDELDNYKSIYDNKLLKVQEICDDIGDTYSIGLEPEFYPSVEHLDGTPDERITLYISPTSVKGKLGDFYPSKIHTGYMGYVIDGVEYSSDIRYLDHRFHTPEADYKPLVSEWDYDELYSQIERHVQRLLQAIDNVDNSVKLHSEAENELESQIEAINKQLGQDILSKSKHLIQELGFLIVCDVNGKQYKDAVSESEALDSNFWRSYIRKVRQRVRSASGSARNSRASGPIKVDFD